MTPQLKYQQVILALAVVALAQLACSFGAQPPSTQPPPASPAPPTEVAPTSTAAASPVPPTNAPQPTSTAAATQPAATSTEAVAPTAAATSQYGTPDEAKAMLQAAVAHYTQVGRQQALSDFTNRVAPFFDRDLYVACIGSDLKQSANGGFPDLVGSPVQPLSQAAWNAATTDSISSLNYSWIDPANGQMLPKTFFYEKVGTDVCGVGAYNPQ